MKDSGTKKVFNTFVIILPLLKMKVDLKITSLEFIFEVITLNLMETEDIQEEE